MGSALPAGTPALYMEMISKFGGTEGELLLGRGIEYRVDRVVLDGKDQWQICGEVIRDE